MRNKNIKKFSLILLAIYMVFAAIKTEAMESGEDVSHRFAPFTVSGFPEKWYAGDQGKKPDVRSQGKYGTCWALSAVSAMESVLLPQTHLVFSADHLSRNNAFSVPIEDGGDYLMIMAYLSGWQGPVLEEEDPYGDEYSPAGLTPAVHVQEIQVLKKADTWHLKELVYKYGAVQTSLFMDRKTAAADQTYYNVMRNAYYYPDEKAQNHDILILGWDDNYSRLNFLRDPGCNGAFICQNTWGESFGEDGIFYVSYADANIGSIGIAYSRIEPVQNYDQIYQHDECGWQGTQGYDTTRCWFANVYTAGENETLSAVGMYATEAGSEYEVYLVHDFETKESLAKREFIQKGTFPNIGYYTADLKKELKIKKGERFAVVVKMTNLTENNPVAVEYQADEYTKEVSLEGKEGYLSPDGKWWQNTEQKFGTNVCLKAYTKLSGCEF